MKKPKRPTTIRVGQRLINWDGTKGYVALNTQGKTTYGPQEPFKVDWLDIDGKNVDDAVYLTLEDFEKEGIRRGRGLMPWATLHL